VAHRSLKGKAHTSSSDLFRDHAWKSTIVALRLNQFVNITDFSPCGTALSHSSQLCLDSIGMSEVMSAELAWTLCHPPAVCSQIWAISPTDVSIDAHEAPRMAVERLTPLPVPRSMTTKISVVAKHIGSRLETVTYWLPASCNNLSQVRGILCHTRLLRTACVALHPKAGRRGRSNVDLSYNRWH
jgi:hypothetical protein